MTKIYVYVCTKKGKMITKNNYREKNKNYISVAEFVQENKLLKINNQRLTLKIQKIVKKV